MVLNLVIEHQKVALGSNCTFMCVWVWVGAPALPLIPSNPPLLLPALSPSSPSPSPVIFSILLFCCVYQVRSEGRRFTFLRKNLHRLFLLHH